MPIRDATKINGFFIENPLVVNSTGTIFPSVHRATAKPMRNCVAPCGQLTSSPAPQCLGSQGRNHNPNQTSDAHGDHRALLVGPAGIDVHAESRERKHYCCGDGYCQPDCPALLEPKPGAGGDIGKTGQKIEPEHERYIVAGGAYEQR